MKWGLLVGARGGWSLPSGLESGGQCLDMNLLVNGDVLEIAVVLTGH